jgi:hypothetical protein
LTLFDDEPEIAEPASADDPDNAVELADVPTDAGYTFSGAKSIAEIKEELRLQNAELAKRVVDYLGWNHSKVQMELNRLANVLSVASATNEQLRQRLRHGEDWLKRIRRPPTR